MSRFRLLPAGTNGKLALAAVVLAAAAVFGDPYAGPRVSLDTEELARVVAAEQDHVTAAELADWIVTGRTDFRLLDLRSAEDYAAYHVPGAESAPLATLPDYPLSRADRLVVYSDGGIHAAQAWMLLKAEGYPAVYTLLGGLDAWKDEVLFPVLPAEPDASRTAQVERARRLAAHFGGTPRGPASGAETDTAAMELPAVAPPPVAATAPPPPKRKKEGC